MFELSKQNIHAISFDLDDTLWNGTEVLIKAEKAMLDWMANNTPEIQQQISRDELRMRKMQFIKDNLHLRHQVSLAREQFLESLFTEFNYKNADALAAQGYDAFYQARQKVILFKDIKETLLALKKQYRLIAITNGNANLELTELKDVFEFCLHGENFNEPKPHGKIFETALLKMNMTNENCLHVGDHPNHDMAGAFQAGMKTCWLKDGSRQWDQTFQPDLTIQHIKELLYPV